MKKNKGKALVKKITKKKVYDSAKSPKKSKSYGRKKY